MAITNGLFMVVAHQSLPACPLIENTFYYQLTGSINDDEVIPYLASQVENAWLQDTSLWAWQWCYRKTEIYRWIETYWAHFQTHEVNTYGENYFDVPSPVLAANVTFLTSKRGVHGTKYVGPLTWGATLDGQLVEEAWFNFDNWASSINTPMSNGIFMGLHGTWSRKGGWTETTSWRVNRVLGQQQHRRISGS